MNYRILPLFLGFVFIIVSLPLPTSNAQTDCELTGDAIRIGATMPLSDPGEVYYGERMLWAFQFAVEEINENCGVEIDGVQHPVELVYRDTAGLAEEGIIAVEELIQTEGVVGIVGEAHSAVALAMIDAVVSLEDVGQSQTPIIISFAWSDDITATHYRNVFRIAPTVSLAESQIAQWIVEQGFQHVAIITENTAYGISAAEADERVLAENDVLVEVIVVDFATEETDAILEQLDAMPTTDMIYIQTLASDAFLSRLLDEDYMPTPERACMIIQNLTPEFWEAHPNAQYCLTTDIRVPEQRYTEMTTTFIENYQAEFDANPIGAAFAAYDSLYLLVDAIDRADSTDSSAINAALEETDITLAQGHYFFPYTSLTPDDEEFEDYMWHQWLDPVAEVLQYQEVGQSPEDAIVIYPYEYSTGEYMTPLEEEE